MPLTLLHKTVTQTKLGLELGVKEFQGLTPLRWLVILTNFHDLVGRHISSVRKVRQIWGCQDMLPDCL
jgi:hypothetical protein